VTAAFFILQESEKRQADLQSQAGVIDNHQPCYVVLTLRGAAFNIKKT
jgi:hypothetical protein